MNQPALADGSLELGEELGGGHDAAAGNSAVLFVSLDCTERGLSDALLVELHLLSADFARRVG